MTVSFTSGPTTGPYTFEDTTRIVDTAVGAMHYNEVGDPAAPKFVLLHGGGPGASSWSNFKQNLPAFAEHFHVLGVDMPGFGRSFQPEFTEGYFSTASKAVIALLDVLGVERAHFLGNSLGGGTTLKIALEQPKRVDRMVLMGPGGGSLNIFYPGLSEGLRCVRDFYRAPGPTREKMREFISIMVFDQRLVTDEFVEERFVGAADPATMEGTDRALQAVRSRDFWSDGELWRDIERLRHRTLITWGRDDKTMPLDGAFFMLKRMPDARLHVFPRCGHWAQLEHQTEFDRLAVDFLVQP